MNDFFFNDVDSFISSVNKNFLQDDIIQWIFKDKIIPLCRKYYDEEKKIQILMSEDVFIKRNINIDNGFFYNSSYGSKTISEPDFLLRNINMYIPSNEETLGKHSIFIFSMHEINIYDLPVSMIPAEAVFYNFILDRINKIKLNFEKKIENNYKYISKLDFVLRTFEQVKAVKVEDLLILNQLHNKSYIEKSLSDFLEISDLVNDFNDKGKLNNLKSMVTQLKEFRKNQNKEDEKIKITL